MRFTCASHTRYVRSSEQSRYQMNVTEEDAGLLVKIIIFSNK